MRAIVGGCVARLIVLDNTIPPGLTTTVRLDRIHVAIAVPVVVLAVCFIGLTAVFLAGSNVSIKHYKIVLAHVKGVCKDFLLEVR